MKRITSIILVFVLVLAAIGVVWLRQGQKDEPIYSSTEGVTTTGQNDSSAQENENKGEESVQYSNPTNSDDLPQEELDTIETVNSSDDEESSDVTLVDEFVIVLDENQGTGGF